VEEIGERKQSVLIRDLANSPGLLYCTDENNKVYTNYGNSKRKPHEYEKNLIVLEKTALKC
jgi:hypothetical protein